MRFLKAKNAEAKTARLLAMNIELPGDGTVPEWVQLLPAGIEIKGRDGRQWILDRQTIILEAFAAEGKDIVIDWEHASELKAAKGDQAPAAGWIKSMEFRSGELWGRVEWTPKAIEQIRNKEYRYLSPVFAYERETRRIVRILSAGLTNQPNLYMTALNQEQIDENLRKEQEIMDLAKLLVALGLPATTTFEEALNRIAANKRELETALTEPRAPPWTNSSPGPITTRPWRGQPMRRRR